MRETIVDDRFVLQERVGAGGMGTVWRAVDRTTNGQVALKIVELADGAASTRFTREAELLAQLQHPNVVRYVAHGALERGRAFLAMEWLEGEDLAARLTRGALAVDEAVALAQAVADALGAAHHLRIVHRDVKPSNLFLVEGRIGSVRLIDFGIARRTTGTRVATHTGVVIGTPGYMAPEQVRGDRDADARCDVFALGCVLFECLAARPVFMGEEPLAVLAKLLLEEAPRLSEVRPDVPGDLSDLVRAMLEKERDARPADGHAVASALSALAAETTFDTTNRRAPVFLGRRERRMVSVLLATPADGRDGTPSDRTLDMSHALSDIETLRPMVEARSGRLELLTTGSIAIVFPDEVAAREQAARAADCALAARAKAPDLAIGVATGRAILSDRLPIGDAIDRAARLVAIARSASSGVRIDEHTAGLLDARFELGGDDNGLLLVGRRATEIQRTLLGRETPHVGRDAELAMIEARLLESASESVGRVALVTAAPGLGKTRLAAELLARARARADAPEIWIARGDVLAEGSPLSLVAQAVRGAAQVVEGEALPVRRRKILARIERHLTGDDALDVAEMMAEIVGAPFDDSDRPALRAARREPAIFADRVRLAFVRWVAAECAAGPLVLVLDDLHWGDAASVRLVDEALRASTEAPFFVLALARSEVASRFPSLWADRGVVSIALSPLSKKAAARLVRHVLGAHIPEADVARLTDLATGNAFYLEELVRAAAAGHADAVPETVLAMVEARLASLGLEDRRRLRLASVFGDRFWAGGLAALLASAGPPSDAGRRELLHALDYLAEAELVARRERARFEGEIEFAFRHALLREAAYATLQDDDRAEGHRLAGEWLEHAGEQDPKVLAEHFERGKDPARAAAYQLKAAEHALSADDLDGALGAATKGIACGAAGELLGRLHAVQTQAHNWRGRFDLAYEAGTASVALLPPGSDAWCSTVGELCAASARLFRKDTVVSACSELLALAETAPTHSLLSTLARLVSATINLGLNELGDTLLAACSRVAAKLGPSDPATAAHLRRARAMKGFATGDTAVFLEQIEAATIEHVQAGDLRNASLARANAGFALALLGQYARAEELLLRVLSDAERAGLALHVLARNNLGMILARTSRLPEARRALELAIEGSRASRNGRVEGGSRTYLAGVLLALGRHAEAEAEARKASEILVGAPPLRAEAFAALSGVLLAQGRNTEALEAAGEARKLLDDLAGNVEKEALVRLAWIDALIASGDRDGAAREVAAAAERLQARAARISDPAIRRSFLEDVRENARTLALAAESRGG